MIENIQKEEIIKAVIAGLNTGSQPDFDHRMDELVSLVEACGIKVEGILTQTLAHPEAGTYLGSGKVTELATLAKEAQAHYCIFDSNLSPAQLKNLTRLIGVEVWDRTNLILEIFSRRAKTKEARLQVESAYLQYMLPRLSGMWQHLGRQGGGGGSRANKGEGEKQIELDRRQIKQRIAELHRELKQIEATRNVQRIGRDRKGMPRAALVGYTNAGKSTILNRYLTMNGVNDEKIVFQEDMLFATLDTSIRRIDTQDNRNFLLSDTVGFIEDLPHSLIKAFRSTLEEAASADLILIVLDASDPYCSRHREVTEETLRELKAENIPKIYVYNKSDLIPDRGFEIPRIREDEIWISARIGKGFDELTEMITDHLYAGNRTIYLKIPYSQGSVLNKLHSRGNVISEEYTPDGIMLMVDCPADLIGEMLIYEYKP